MGLRLPPWNPGVHPRTCPECGQSTVVGMPLGGRKGRLYLSAYVLLLMLVLSLRRGSDGLAPVLLCVPGSFGMLLLFWRCYGFRFLESGLVACPSCARIWVGAESGAAVRRQRARGEGLFRALAMSLVIPALYFLLLWIGSGRGGAGLLSCALLDLCYLALFFLTAFRPSAGPRREEARR